MPPVSLSQYIAVVRTFLFSGNNNNFNLSKSKESLGERKKYYQLRLIIFFSFLKNELKLHEQ